MKNYSIAIFGSSLRADFDKYSDKDLLIAAKDFETLNKLKDVYSKEDWSISYYTYSKLEYLSNNGSLFIKHLQIESNIKIDKKDRLKNILSKLRLKKDYKKDIKDSKEYFQILKTVPKTNFGFAWFCDCMFVGLRNYLVFKNAENDIFEFSFNKLLNILKNQNKITECEVEILKELRVVKRNYRENILDELPSYEFVKKIKIIAEKLNLINQINIISSIDFRKNIESKILNENFNPYQRLRLVEGYYCSQEQNIPELKKIISNPQFYASKMKSNEFTMNLIKEIRKTPHNNVYKSLGNKCLTQS